MMLTRLLCILLLIIRSGSLVADSIIISAESDIQSVVNTLNPGDTLLFSSGIYSGPLSITVNGTNNQPIVLMSLASEPSDYAVIDGGADNPGLELSNHWLDFENASWVEVVNMHFQNGWTDPIRIENSSYLSFKNCHFVGGRRVIRARDAGVHHILVENCFWDQGGRYLWEIDQWMGADAWDEMHSGSLRFFNGSLFASEGTDGGHVIRGNTILHAFNALRWRADQGMDENIEIYDNRIENIRDNDFEPEDYTSNLFIHHNQSHNVHKTLSIDNVNGGNIYYFGNTITTDISGRAPSIATGFYKIYGEAQNVTEPIYIFNNSFFGTGRVHGSIDNRTIQHVIHVNNAYELTQRRWELNQWNETLSYNYDCSNLPFSPVLTANDQEINGIVAVPGYINGASQELRLLDDSPCIDAGTMLSVAALDWVQPYKGNAPDIGAFDSNEPVTGPFFRVKESRVPELPRITLVTQDHDSTNVSFSTPLLTSSIAGNIVKIDHLGNEEEVTDFIVVDNGHTVRLPTQSNEAPFYVKSGLLGENGYPATNWSNYDSFDFEEKDQLVNVLFYSTEGGTITIDEERRILQPGTTIQLSADTEPGYEFLEWDGDLRSAEKDISLDVEHSMLIIARFRKTEAPLSTYVNNAPDFYPNPSSGRIHFNREDVRDLMIMKLSGDLIYSSGELINNELDLNFLPSGIYLITYSCQLGSIKKKLIIH